MIYEHTNNGKNFLIVEVPEGSYDHFISSKFGILDWFVNKSGHTTELFTIDLPPGSWEIMGMGETLTESKWDEVVKNNGWGCYNNYKGKPDEIYTLLSAIESGLALISSHKLTPTTALFLKEVKPR